MRSVRRGEAAYLELMREAKEQFDAEIAKNKEKGKAGRPRKEVAPVVVEDDGIEIDFSDVVSPEEAEAIAAPVPVKVAEKKPAPKAAPARPKSAPPAKSAPAAKKAPAKKVVAKKAPAKKAPAKKASAKKGAKKR
ncbi:MAG: hypothetical protein ABI969_04020 [bacterium]